MDNLKQIDKMDYFEADYKLKDIQYSHGIGKSWALSDSFENLSIRGERPKESYPADALEEYLQALEPNPNLELEGFRSEIESALKLVIAETWGFYSEIDGETYFMIYLRDVNFYVMSALVTICSRYGSTFTVSSIQELDLQVIQFRNEELKERYWLENPTVAKANDHEPFKAGVITDMKELSGWLSVTQKKLGLTDEKI